MTDPNITHLLNTDPIVEAEKITGHSYKEDQATAALGMLLNIDHGARKREALAQAGDSHFRMTYDEFLVLLTAEGFRQVHSLPFTNTYGQTETYSIWWRGDGILVTAESYTWTSRDREAPTVNSAKAYYNWRSHPGENYWPGGSFQGLGRDDDDRLTIAGDSDVREGFKHKLAEFTDHGQFLNPWLKRPFLWFKDYSQKDDNYEEINEALIATLPERVRTAITPTT